MTIGQAPLSMLGEAYTTDFFQLPPRDPAKRAALFRAIGLADVADDIMSSKSERERQAATYFPAPFAGEVKANIMAGVVGKPTWPQDDQALATMPDSVLEALAASNERQQLFASRRLMVVTRRVDILDQSSNTYQEYVYLGYVGTSEGAGVYLLARWSEWLVPFNGLASLRQRGELYEHALASRDADRAIVKKHDAFAQYDSWRKRHARAKHWFWPAFPIAMAAGAIAMLVFHLELWWFAYALGGGLVWMLLVGNLHHHTHQANQWTNQEIYTMPRPVDQADYEAAQARLALTDK